MNEGTTVHQGARTASRHAAWAIALTGLAGIGLAFILLSSFRAERAVQEEIQVHHLRSASLASEVHAGLTALRHIVHDLEVSQPSGFLGHEELDKALAEIRSSLGALEEIPVVAADPVMSASHPRVMQRFARLEELLAGFGAGRRPTHDESHRVLQSVDLAVEQLRRLHSIEAGRQIAAMASRSARRNAAIGAVVALFAAAVLMIGRRTLGLLHRTFAREEELRAKVERARLNQQREIKMDALGRLAGGVAHDFNNLLAVILAHSEALQGTLGPGSPLLQETEGIKRATDQAAALTRQLLAFSRRDLGGSGEREVVDLNWVIRDMEILLSRLLGDRSSLVVNLEPELGAVRADPRQLERVLVNLVSNAGDAMPSGGTVTIETTNLRAKPDSDEAETQDLVRISVCDTGHGMNEEVRDRAFEPFFTTKDVANGTGLGLSTVHGMVIEAGGWIEVESELEIGTRVDVYLPRLDVEPEDDGESQEPVGAPPSGETILLVEDERDVRRVSARVLREAGYTVLESEDGARALELCSGRREPIDLILTDVVMPGLDGLQLAEQAKSHHPEARILFMSGYNRAELPPGGRLLSKPFRRDDLLSTVRSSLGA